LFKRVLDENILIHVKTRQIKLIDFGSATHIDPNDPNKTCTLFYGTKKFAAPEAVRNEPYIPDCQESWALGTLLFVLLFKLDPFTTDEEILSTDIGRRIARFKAAAARQSTASKGGESGGLQISDGVVALLKALMDRDPAKRMRVKEILRNPVFK
jgi:serine/threonine protein kinase